MSYVKAVERFAQHFHAPPERLGPEQIRQYLLYLINERKVCFNTLHVHRAALQRAIYLSIQDANP